MYEFFIVRVTNRVDGTFGNSVKGYKTEAEAIKEFAARLKEKSLVTRGDFALYGKIVAVSKIDNLVKEMTEDENDG